MAWCFNVFNVATVTLPCKWRNSMELSLKYSGSLLSKPSTWEHSSAHNQLNPLAISALPLPTGDLQGKSLKPFWVTNFEVMSYKNCCCLTLSQLVGLIILPLEGLLGSSMRFCVMIRFSDHLSFRQFKMLNKDMVFIFLTQMDIRIQKIVQLSEKYIIYSVFFNFSKTKEMTVDYRKSQSRVHSSRAYTTVERLKNFLADVTFWCKHLALWYIYLCPNMCL